MWQSSVFFLAVALLACVPDALCDTPANCTYEEMSGAWTFYLGSGGHDNKLDCSDSFQVARMVKVNLTYPDVATDDQGNTGFWTIIYNQGFEVVIDKRKYFAFSNYTQISKTVAVSHCFSTLNGWSHNVDESDWACYYGVKSSAEDDAGRSVTYLRNEDDRELDRPYVKNVGFVDAINNRTKLWEAVRYPEMEGMTLRDLHRRAGGIVHHGTFPPVASVCPKTRVLARELPIAMDWRDVKGESFVTPIRNQGACGSCYAFASMAMLESRLMIMSKGSVKKVFSPQDVVSCSEYAQGCEGGFPYLIAGKYAEDFGVVEESCLPYLGVDTSRTHCEREGSCARFRATDYKYVGGYFGACNEQEMLMALQDGPVSVAFEVTDDFQHYKRGIYHATGLRDSFNPFRLTNHAVLAVGYGEQLGVKYWIVKNSWGASWGEDGYFRIRRGTNELNIESMAVISTPVMP